MTIAAIILLLLTVLFAVATIGGFKRWGENSAGVGTAIACYAIAGIIAFVLACVTGWMAVRPEYNLHRASIEKRILVEQARAEADAAKEEARAEVARARGTAEANKIVANSITEPYLRYLYINNLAKTDNQIVYLPTEAGLPILEAQRTPR